MTIEELLREGLADLAGEARPDADYLAGVERHIQAERRRRRVVQGAVAVLSVALLAAAVLTVPWLRQLDTGPASPTTTIITTTTTIRRAGPGKPTPRWSWPRASSPDVARSCSGSSRPCRRSRR